MNPLSQPKNAATLPLVIALALGCFAIAPQARAVCQEGCLTSNNTVLGDDALLSNTTGNSNTAVGFQALIDNTTGFGNTATGWQALVSNTTGAFNTATGVVALQNNTTGNANTATGYSALKDNTTGISNTATGWQVLLLNTTGFSNTANGSTALQNNTTGFFNTASGVGALLFNTTDSNNTAIGSEALFRKTSGSNNIAVGSNAGGNLTAGSYNVYIGNGGIARESGAIRIGGTGTTNAYIAGISGATVPTGVAVIVDSSGHLGTTTSSARFKETIKPMDKASESILALKPVTFRYKHELDPERIPQFGLVAEDVEKANPDLVARDADGKPYTVRYDAVNAMLLNEFLKEHRKVQELEANDAEQQREIKALVATVKEQAAQIQKVRAQVELSKPAPQTVLNNQ
jgi:trimeric autotransporter adhesin